MNSWPRMVDSVTTLARPSAPQKRFWAKGRSAEMHSTTVFGLSLALALNWRTEVAQVGVSMLGKMLRILRLPARLLRLTSDRSLATSEKAGAASPFLGKLPLTLIGLPPRVTDWDIGY